jgi:hypothetical protein
VAVSLAMYGLGRNMILGSQSELFAKNVTNISNADGMRLRVFSSYKASVVLL